MARSLYSPSPSPRSLSPSFSDSSDDVSVHSDHPDGVGPSGSQPGSPGGGAEQPEADSVTCLWEDCSTVFTHLPSLIEHIHSDHIGVHKSNYTCEWATCSRRGLAQTSRFALISHIRSHTGEKPFTCPRPECDKSFTRSDALAKHMRLQHNISPPLPGRGGNRKRKRDFLEPEPVDPQQQQQAPSPLAPQRSTSTPASSTTAFNTFKIEPQTPAELPAADDDYFGSARSSPGSDDDDGSGDLPPHLLQTLDPQTGLIMGRSPDMVRYLVTKAKHKYALEQHESLIEELRVVRAELRRERAVKESVLDTVLRANFGPQAEVLIEPVRPPQGLSVSRHRPPVEMMHP